MLNDGYETIVVYKWRSLSIDFFKSWSLSVSNYERFSVAFGLFLPTVNNIN